MNLRLEDWYFTGEVIWDKKIFKYYTFFVIIVFPYITQSILRM